MAALGTALAGAVALLDPQAIILAGGVAASSDVLAPLVLPSLRRHLPPHLRGIGIKAGVFGPKAGLIGAAFAGRLGKDWERVHA
jgi:glucokinase